MSTLQYHLNRAAGTLDATTGLPTLDAQGAANVLAGIGGSTGAAAISAGTPVRVGTLANDLSQTSGLAASRANPGVLYGLLDYSSGGDNTVKIINAGTSEHIGTITLTGATNVDWEDIEVSHYDGSIWVGDIGNYGDGAALGQGTQKLYQFPEPDMAVTQSVTPTTYEWRYADSSTVRMSEALTVRPSDGRVFIIASAGRIWEGPASLSTSSVNVFTSGTQLTVTGDVTGASWSPDGKYVAVITRSENVYIFDSSWVQVATWVVPQTTGNTEAICWDHTGRSVYHCFDNSAGTGSALYLTSVVTGGETEPYKDLVGALNVAAGNSLPDYKELAGVLNQLAGTTGLEVVAAAAAIP